MQVADILTPVLTPALQACGASADQPKLLHKEQRGPLLLTASKHSAGDLSARGTQVGGALSNMPAEALLALTPALQHQIAASARSGVAAGWLYQVVSGLQTSADCDTLLQDHCHCWPGLGDQSQQLLTGLHRRCSLASTSPATAQGTEGTFAALHDGAAASQHLEEAHNPASHHQAGPKVFVGVLTAAGNAAARQAGDLLDAA